MTVIRHCRPPKRRPVAVLRARKLRRDATEAERRLWRAIRDRQLDDVKFRRQVPIGSYIVDFECRKHRVVIEVDGGQHADNRRHDEIRTRALVAEGYRVLRFWNNEVTDNLDGVLETIRAVLKG